MGRGLTEITLAQLATVVGRYNNVIWMSDPSDTDLMKTIIGQPRTVVINLAQLLNLATGDIQGDAIAIDELEATEIADDAVRGRELAETPSLFQTATEVTHDHDTGTGATILAANAAGEGDRLVLCQVEVTETFAATSWEIDVGSTSDPNGLFDDIFVGLATLQINETLVGAYLLPEGEALTVTETSMVGDTAGQLTFRLIVSDPAAGSIPGNLLADDAIGNFENVSAVAVDHAAGSPVELLAAHATDDRLCLVMGIATETAAGGPDIDVGSAVTAVNAAFDDISGGTWVIGERWMGACMLPAGEALNATIVGAGTAGAIDFYVIPLTVLPSGVVNLFVGGTELEHDHATGTQTLLAANAAGGGDRLVICQAECTEAFVVATSWEIDVGSTSSANGLFDDIFGGDLALAIGESVIGSYLLPEGEALTITENDMTGDTAGKIMFRVLVNTPAAGSIPGNLLADDAVGDFHTSTTVNVADTEGPTKQLLAAHASNDRVVLVMGVATVSASGGPDFDVGSDTTAINSVFDDIAAGAWVVGERWVGACLLPAGEDLIATITAGTGGAIDFHMIVLTIPTASAQNLFEDGTNFEQDHGAGTQTILAANAAGAGDRMVVVQAEVTEAWAGTSWEYDVGSTSSSNGLFDDIFGGPVPLAIGTSVIGAYLLPEAEALTCTENDMTGITAGKIMFRILISTPAAGSIPGNLLANDAVGHFAPSGVMGAAVGLAHDAASPFELLAADANNDRLVMVMAVATETAAGGPDIDIGSETTDTNSVFDDLAAGAWVIGERFVGGCLLPAGEALDATIAAAGTAGELDIYMVVLPMAVQTAQVADAAITGIKLAATPNLFETATVVTQDHDTGGPATLLAANAAGGGDRLVVVQAEVTEAFATTSWEWDVGSTANGDGLFDDIFAGVAALALGETLMGMYLLPEGEALVLTETDMTGDTTGQITFRILVTDAAAGSIPGALLADDAIGLFEDITPTTVAFGGAATQQILASDANSNRHVLVLAIAGVAANGCDWDVGAGAGNEVFDDISDGTWVAGERWMGACDLPAGSALNVTLQTAGTAGSIDFYVIALTPLAATANIVDAAVTGVKLAATPSLFENPDATFNQQHDTGTGTVLAANSAGGGDRLLVVQAEVTEAFVTTSWEIDVGSTSSSDGLFDDIFGGVADLAVGETLIGAYLLPEGEALTATETDMTGDSAGIIRFNILISAPAAGSIPGALLANDAVGHLAPSGVIAAPVGLAHDAASPFELLAADASNDRLVLVMAVATETAAGNPDIDIGSETTDTNAVFDDLAAGAWVVGERFFGGCLLPAGEALDATIAAAGTAGEFDIYLVILPMAVQTAQIADNAVTPDKVLDIASAGAEAGVGFKMAMAEYTFVNLAADAGMYGATSIPSGALVMGGYLEVITALGETNGGGEVDVGLDLEGANDLLADTAWNGAPWNGAGIYSLVPDFTGANAVLTTAPRDITISIVLNGATNIASGAIRVVLFYIEPKTGAI